MAGKRQHYITQELQRGFSFNDRQVYRYSARSKGPQLVNITKNGLQKRFYGDEGCITDTLLTDFENRTTHFFQYLRSDHEIYDVEKLVNLVYISLVRSRNFRLAIEQLADEVTNGFANALDDMSPYHWISSSVENDPTILEDSCKEELIKMGYKEGSFEFKKAFWLLMFHSLLNYKQLLLEGRQWMESSVSDVSRRFRKEKFVSGQKVQARIVSEFWEKKFEVIKILQKMSWKIRRFEEPLILGDSPVVLVNRAFDYGVFFEPLGEIAAVFMPIDTNSVIIGGEIPYDVPVDVFNTMSASVSVEYFVAESVEHFHYVNNIGSKIGVRHKRNWESEVNMAIRKRAGW